MSKSTKIFLIMIIFFCTVTGAGPVARAADLVGTNKAAQKGIQKSGANDPGKGMRKKDITFEERVIEGMSGRNYESLSQTGTTEGAVGDRLYRKRANFDEESKTLLREMEYLK